MAFKNPLLFGASYYPHHYDPQSWARDLDLMVEAGVNALRIGDFAWAHLQPAERTWNFEWLDQFMAFAHQRQIGVLLVPPLRCAPAWLVEKEPSIQIVDDAGVTLEFGSRYTFCINHPALREYGFALTHRMVERYKGHPATLGWHIDNEYGDEPDCHCERCKTKWQHWLELRYENIEALNRAWKTIFWGLTFNTFAQIPTPRRSKTYHHPALLQAWRQFRSDCTVEIVQLHAAAVRTCDSSRYITTNLQCLWNPRTDYFDLKMLDIAGVNYYPAYGAGCRDSVLGLAVARGVRERNFQVHELRNGPHAVPGRANNTPAPGEVERLTMHCIGHGADAIFYFQWRGVPFGPEQSHGTLVNSDGTPNRVYHEAKNVGLRLKELMPLLENSRVESEIAVLYDFPTRWAMQGGAEWVGPPNLYLEQATRVYNAIRKLGVNCDVVGRQCNWSRFKILVVPLLNCLDEVTIERLCRFVDEGGVLVWHPLSGTKNSETEIFEAGLHPKLQELFGLNIVDFATTGEDEAIPFTWQGQSYSGHLYCDLPVLSTARCLGSFAQGWFCDSVALSENSFGHGRAVYIATFADTDFYQNFFESLCRETQVRLLLNTIPPAEVEVTERRLANGRNLLFLLNSTGESQMLRLSGTQHLQDIWNAETMSGIIPFEPWQVRICLL